MQFDPKSVAIKIVTLFIVLICGVYARRRKFINEESTTSLSRLLLNVTQPALIVSSFLIEYRVELIINSLFVLLASVVVHFFSAILAKWLFMKEKCEDKNVVYRYGLIFANCSFLGFPILEIIFPGGEGIFYGSFYCIMFNLFNWTYGFAMMQKNKGKKIFLKAVINPGTVSTLVGIAIFMLKIKLPIFISDALSYVGNMTFPLSMIIIGSLCSTIDFRSALKRPGGYLFCAAKNLLLPIIAVFVTNLFELPNVVRIMTIVMCAMPMATSGAMFADTFGRDKKLAAQIVGMSTFFSVATIPLILLLADRI